MTLNTNKGGVVKILSKSFGAYATNCYILIKDCGEIIIDPGDGALEFVRQNCKNLLAILNTHCHFDHIYDDKKIKDEYNLPIYVPKDDAFLCSKDPFGMIEEPFNPDFLVEPDGSLQIADFTLKFHHFAGHTPGCSMIETNGVMFSGDFLFKGSIGRYDFPFSSKIEMKNSLKKALNLGEFVLYPGHGEKTSMSEAREFISYFIERL